MARMEDSRMPKAVLFSEMNMEKHIMGSQEVLQRPAQAAVFTH